MASGGADKETRKVDRKIERETQASQSESRSAASSIGMGRKNWPRVNKRKLNQKGTNTINQIFELNQIHLPNGCVGVDTAPIIAAA
jgi:hypothetical protein